MKIYSVTDPLFKGYGKIHKGYDSEELCMAMLNISLPESGVAYETSLDVLEFCDIFEELSVRAYGGMPIQLGMCWGRNTKLNCLEYHRDSEVNIGTDDFILLLAKQEEIVDGEIDTAKVKVFHVPAGEIIELYSTTLHYAPCHADKNKGFRVAVVLPKGTNTEKPVFELKCKEDRWMTARN